MNSPLSPDQLAAILKIAAAGNKIDATKEYRAMTGEGLAEAKAAVEKMMEDAGLVAPGSKAKIGCVGMLVAGVGIVGTAWALWAK